MTEFVQPVNQSISHFQLGSMNDVDNFDIDRLNSSLQYGDHHIIEDNTKKKERKKLKKKEEENEKR
ncbi:unnamed protein product, partial [Rotaria sordida]